jgi:hypothetical protein
VVGFLSLVGLVGLVRGGPIPGRLVVVMVVVVW